MTVACVYRPGADYSGEYVEKLAAGIRRHSRSPVRIVCLTDAGNEVRRFVDEIIPLEHPLWPGWWSKIEVFRLRGPVLYLDLDTVVMGDPLPNNGIMSIAGLVMLRDFGQAVRPESGVMAWETDMLPIYHLFLDELDALGGETWKRTHSGWSGAINGVTYRGDAAWIASAAERLCIPISYVQKHVKGIYSYKYHMRRVGIHEPPPDAKLICFHGKPRPRDVRRLLWMKEAWSA